MSDMRAKVEVTSVNSHEHPETGEKVAESLLFTPVSKKEGYGNDGLDENNTFAKFTPGGEFRLAVTNPALWGKFEAGQEYYVDFTKVTK